MNIAHHLERAVLLFRDRIALIFEGQSYTYQQLEELVNCAANTLQQLGINKGDRVGLFLPNIPEFIISYLGILKLGAIAVSVNAMLKSPEIEYILNDCRAKIIVTTAKLAEEVPSDNLPFLEHTLIAEGKAKSGNSLISLLADASPIFPARELEADTPAEIVYASDTSGLNKSAILSHSKIISNIYSQNRCCQIKPGDRFLLHLPLFYCLGHNAILNSALNVSGTIILQRQFKLEHVLVTIVRERVTMFFAVPTVYIKLLNANISPTVLSSVNYYFSAASIPMDISRRWQQKYGLLIHEDYQALRA